MNKILSNYQLFLFDFDGLLVNTEELHYLAYKQMMQARGICLNWSFERYCQSAHYSSEKLREDIFRDYPALQKQDPSWEHLYREKQAAMQELIHQEHVHLMPGVERLLNHLQQACLKHVVVTHSSNALISEVRKKHPVLGRIPYWITRQDYTHAKPHSECYQIAIERYSDQKDKVIGFEDSPRGITALLGTKATPILITKVPYPEIPTFIEKGAQHFPSLEDFEKANN